MHERQARTEQIEDPGEHGKSGAKGDNRIAKEQAGRRGEVAGVREGLAVPLIPLVAQPAIGLDADQLCACGVSHDFQA
jgi:hypothetical protein